MGRCGFKTGHQKDICSTKDWRPVQNLRGGGFERPAKMQASQVATSPPNSELGLGVLCKPLQQVIHVIPASGIGFIQE